MSADAGDTVPGLRRPSSWRSYANLLLLAAGVGGKIRAADEEVLAELWARGIGECGTVRISRFSALNDPEDGERPTSVVD